MSILKYFKHAPVMQDEELPEPSSCLSNVNMWIISFFMATACGLLGLPTSRSQINCSLLNWSIHKLLYL